MRVRASEFKCARRELECVVATNSDEVVKEAMKIRIKAKLSSIPSNPLTTTTATTTKQTFSHLFRHYSKHQASISGRSAHARMITSGFTPSVFVSNCLIHMYVRCSNLDYAHKMFDRIPQKDTISWNALISGYSQNGSVSVARSLFDSMPDRDAISWNTMISCYLDSGDPRKSVELFSQMDRTGIELDHTTFAVALKSCSALEDHNLGAQIHGLSVKMALDLDVVMGSAVVDMYAKSKCLSESIRFFDSMPERNWVSWSATIGGCVHNGRFFDGLQLFVKMQREGIGVSQSVYASALRSCAGMSSALIGSQFHGHALKTNFSDDVIVGTAILDMYAKSDHLEDAKNVFRRLPTRTLQSWNAIVVGLARSDRGLEALQLFQAMNRSGIGFNEISLSGAFSACSEAKGYFQGLQVHCLAVKTGLVSDVCVQNAVLDTYGKCKMLIEARAIFNEMNVRDSVSWNAIVAALEQNGEWEDTMTHFDRMLQCGMQPDEFTYGSVLKACAGLQSLGSGLKIHEKIIKSGLGLDPFIGTALIDMYCKCGAIDEARKIHSRIEEQATVSWNAIISGFSLQKQGEESQNLFFEMLQTGLNPDNFTYATIIDTCANLTTDGLGKQIHARTIKAEELRKDVFVSSALVDMYSKCGNMHDSLLMFEKMVDRDFVSWNAVICGYAQHGLGLEAIAMFERMQTEGVRPNHATFLAVLRACGHVGLIDMGIAYFDSMMDRYGLDPQLEHYSSMVDIVGRSKGTREAMRVIDEMPFEADSVIWRALLSVSKINGDVEVAELAAANVLRLDPEDSATYILLSNVYAGAGRWADVLRMRRGMRRTRMKKEPGCSWVEVKSATHAFVARDTEHLRCEEIYERLDELIQEMKWAGYLPEIDLFVDDEEEEENGERDKLGVCNG